MKKIFFYMLSVGFFILFPSIICATVACLNGAGPLLPGQSYCVPSIKLPLIVTPLPSIFHPAVLTTINISPSSASLILGGVPQQLTANTIDQFSKTINATLIWTSSNNAIAKVSATGLVTAVAVGTANITASSGSIKSALTVITVTKSPNYSYIKANVGNAVEHRLYYNQQHFITIVIDANKAIAIRPHPGLDKNGWGSSLYLEPFLPGAILRGTTVQSVYLQNDGINVVVTGIVSRGSSGSYGTWNGNFTFNYDPSQKDITGFGTYDISLAGALSSSTGDLNLYKLASNYLIDVPLLNGTKGNTGDMSSVVVSGGNLGNFTWDPTQGSTYPQDYRNPISVALIGDYNQVNTAAQGYAPIAAAYKPSMKVSLSSGQTGLPLIFGAAYNSSQSKQYWQDNVGITPLILRNSTYTKYSFNLNFDFAAIVGDH